MGILNEISVRSPLLDEHTDAMLSEVLGYEDGEIDALREAVFRHNHHDCGSGRLAANN